MQQINRTSFNRTALVTALVSLCLWFSSATANAQDIRFNRSEIQSSLEQKMPLHYQHSLFSLAVHEPTLHLEERTQRIGLQVKLTFNSVLGLASQGSALVDGQPRYHPEDHSFYLDDARIQHMTLEGIPEQFIPQIQTILQDVIRGYLAEQPLYTIKNRNMTESMARMMLRSIEVKDDQIIAKLGIF